VFDAVEHDEVRAAETRRMLREGREPVLKKSRWLLLKRSENLGDDQHFRLRDLLRHNLRTVRAYLLKEAFQQLWDYNSLGWAGKFLDEWCRQTMRSRIEPMKKIARSLRQHRELILNYFRAQKLISSNHLASCPSRSPLTISSDEPVLKRARVPDRLCAGRTPPVGHCCFARPPQPAHDGSDPAESRPATVI
jgi:hypothetical protein